MGNNRHIPLQKPNGGNFGRLECSLLGTTCEEIKDLVDKIRSAIPESLIGYADAEHNSTDFASKQLNVTFAEHYTTSVDSSFSSAQRSPYFSNADFILINGNHFAAENQLLIVNPSKGKSIEKRLTNITHPIGVYVPKGQIEIPAFIQNIVDQWNLPVYYENRFDQFIAFLKNTFIKIPVLKGLVLTGGKSTRMGSDKCQLQFNGVPQYKKAFELIQLFTKDVFISCRKDQSASYPDMEDRFIFDRIIDIGPMGGIISAFMYDPNAAWLVMACDLLLVNQETIEELITQRNASAIATAPCVSDPQFPEPLMAIWEPKAFPLLVQSIVQGQSCPRKLLIQNKCTRVFPKEGYRLANVNSPEDLLRVQSYLTE